MAPTDRTETCASCNQPFTLTAGELEFFASRGLHTPRRCKACRKAGSASAKASPTARGADPRGPRPSPFGTRGAPVHAPRSIAEDPNAYRSPADFGARTSAPAPFDKSGLPVDDEDAGNVAQPAEPGNDRFGMRTDFTAAQGGPFGRRGPSDRSGTNPNAYRSPSASATPIAQRRDRGDSVLGGRAVGKPGDVVAVVEGKEDESEG